MQMPRQLPPVVFFPTMDLRGALGEDARAAGVCAFREIVRAARGLEINHLQFEFRGITIAVCSRARADGRVVIEAGFGNPNLPRFCFTAEEARRAEARVVAPGGARKEGGTWQTTNSRRTGR